MICYLRTQRPPGAFAPVANASSHAAVIDVEGSLLDNIEDVARSLGELDAQLLVFLSSGANAVPEGFEQRALAHASYGGIWIPDSPEDGVVCLNLTKKEAFSVQLHRAAPVIEAATLGPCSGLPRNTQEPARSSAAVRAVDFETLRQAQRESANDIIEAIRMELQRRDRDVDILSEKSASAASSAYARANFKNADIMESAEKLLISAASEAPLGGLCLEFGVYQGRTISMIAGERDGAIYGFDSFDGLPEDWRPGFPAGAFATPPPCVPPSVTLIKGLFSDSLPDFLSEHTGEVSFAHIDCDLYSSTATVLRLVGPRFVSGTVVVFDEYYNYPGWEEHEKRAWVEYCQGQGIKYEYLSYVPHGEQVAVRVTAV